MTLTLKKTFTKENAILLDTDEHFVENLTSAILNLYEHPEIRQQMSEASIDNSKYYNHQRYAEDFFKALEGV